MNVFTYGTLMIPAVMHAVTARKFRFESAMLKGYARFTVKGELYPGIMPQTDATTEGIVYFNVDELALERLDAFEGALYQRTAVRVETEGKERLSAETYVIKPEYQRFLSSKKWDPKAFVQKNLDAFLNTFAGFADNA